MSSLSQKELVQLIQSVFPKLKDDKQLAILVDVPNRAEDDTEPWKQRRSIAESWATQLKEMVSELELQNVLLVGYPSVDSNNADLSSYFYSVPQLPSLSSEFKQTKISAKDFYTDTQIILAPTQYSATAPLKVAAREHQFRAATMPGFSKDMFPALRIDYERVNRRCQLLRKKLNDAEEARVIFETHGETFNMYFDLRHRHAHASSGRFPDPGMAGNLPSGETYIVPYEGELDIPSETHGILPVQFDDEVVLFRVKDNKASEVLSHGPQSREQQNYLDREPAYRNMAELGFGFLGDFGLKPIGTVLLDEKLGFHVAFGRSDHFGGAVGPSDFTSPSAVVHIDRIFIKETQPDVVLKSIELNSLKSSEVIMKSGQYQIFEGI